MNHLISIILPVYNVEKYLKECLSSVIGQTYKNLEIICINDGSTDSSRSILAEYADRDSRIIIIDQKNKGYGAAINKGIEFATGKYIGIVESDDFIVPEMYASLLELAEEHHVDIVKSEYNFYWAKEDRIKYSNNISAWVANKIIKQNSPDYQNVFHFAPSIWSALYSSEFLKNQKIRCLETAGASYQDISFNFKAWACAKSTYLYPAPLLYYRQDNAQSSINDKSKIYCVCTECDEIRKFIDHCPERHDYLLPLSFKHKYRRYRWNLSRLSFWRKWEFLKHMQKEFTQDSQHPKFDKSLFPFDDWNLYQCVIKSPLLAATYLFSSSFLKIRHKNYTWRIQLFGLRIYKRKGQKSPPPIS